MRVKKKLGEMLVENGLITPEQLEQALNNPKRAGLKLGQYLIRNGFITESQLVDMLSTQLKIPKFNLEQYQIDSNLSGIIPFAIAEKMQVAPLQKKGRLLIIAVLDPLDINAFDTLETMTNCEIESVICTEMELSGIHRVIYASSMGISAVVQGLDAEEINVTSAEDEAGGEDVQVASLQGMAGEAPVIKLVNSILSSAVQERASDVHISPQKNNMQIRFRIDGKLHDKPALPKSMFLPIIARFKILANMDITVSRVPQDGRFTIKLNNREINIRASTVPTIYGENLVLRLLDTSQGVYSLDKLGMAEDDLKRLMSMIYKPYGMILTTGPTGSGKTTSLYSILNEVNKPDIHIITLEDPVEYRINNIRQIQLNTKAGMTFASGLRAILRQDPDIIMVGEIRDSETATIAVQAAQTGHRLLSTTHTNDAAGAVARLVDMGIEPFLVANVLLVVIGQRLMRTVCPYCKEPYTPPQKALEQWGLDKYPNPTFMIGKGCYQCNNTGYKGRIGVYEVLVNDETVQDLILSRASAAEITRVLVQSGKMRTLKQDAAMKVAKGLTTLAEAESTVMV